MPDNPITLRDKTDPDAFRMSIGDHLEELRWRLIYALLGFAVFSGVCLLFGTHVMAAFCKPLIYTLQKYEVNPQVYFTQISDPFMVFIKVSLITAAAFSGPWMLYQIWQFVASGLYPNERHTVTKYVPLSIALLISGMVFVYYIVLPLTLAFFMAFSVHIPLPSAYSPDVHIVTPHPTTIPTLGGDPVSPMQGQIWLNSLDGRIKVFVNDQVRVMPFGPQNLTAPIITLPDYIDLVFGLLLIFGLSFQLPLVIVALAAMGVVEVATMRRTRRIVYFVITVASAAIVPGDVITATVALMVPLIILYELGIWLSRRNEKSALREDSAAYTDASTEKNKDET